jgi:hypothetical protein
MWFEWKLLRGLRTTTQVRVPAHVLAREHDYAYFPFPQHRLYLLPEPQGQGSLRPIFSLPRTTCCTG